MNNKEDIIKCYGLDDPIYEYKNNNNNNNRKSIELLESLNIGENMQNRIELINNYKHSIKKIKLSNSRLNLLRSLNIGSDDDDRERANSKSQENNILEESNIIINDSEKLILFKDLVRNISKDLEETIIQADLICLNEINSNKENVIDNELYIQYNNVSIINKSLNNLQTDNSIKIELNQDKIIKKRNYINKIMSCFF